MKKTLKPYYSATGPLKTNFGNVNFYNTFIYLFIGLVYLRAVRSWGDWLLLLSYMGFFGISDEAFLCQITKAYEKNYLI